MRRFFYRPNPKATGKHDEYLDGQGNPTRAPKDLHPGEIVSPCAIVEISPEEIKLDPTLIGSTWLYTVEFWDGLSIEVPKWYLEPYLLIDIATNKSRNFKKLIIIHI